MPEGFDLGGRVPVAIRPHNLGLDPTARADAKPNLRLKCPSSVSWSARDFYFTLTLVGAGKIEEVGGGVVASETNSILSQIKT